MYAGCIKRVRLMHQHKTYFKLILSLDTTLHVLYNFQKNILSWKSHIQ